MSISPAISITTFSLGQPSFPQPAPTHETGLNSRHIPTIQQPQTTSTDPRMERHRLQTIARINARTLPKTALKSEAPIRPRIGKHKKETPPSPEIPKDKLAFALNSVATFAAKQTHLQCEATHTPPFKSVISPHPLATKLANTCMDPAHITPAEIDLHTLSTRPISPFIPPDIQTIHLDHTKNYPGKLAPKLKMSDGEIFTTGDISDGGLLGTELLHSSWIMAPLQAIQHRHPAKIQKLFTRLPNGDINIGPLWHNHTPYEFVIPKDHPQLDTTGYKLSKLDTDGDGRIEINAQLVYFAFQHLAYIIFEHPDNVQSDACFDKIVFDAIYPGQADTLAKAATKDAATKFLAASKMATSRVYNAYTYALQSSTSPIFQRLGFGEILNPNLKDQSVIKQQLHGYLFDPQHRGFLTDTLATILPPVGRLTGIGPRHPIGPPNANPGYQDTIFSSGLHLFFNRYFYEKNGIGAIFTPHYTYVGLVNLNFNPHGYGVCLYQNNSHYEGFFEDGNPQPPGTLYL